MLKLKCLVKSLTYASIVKIQHDNRESIGILLGKKHNGQTVVEDVFVDTFLAEWGHTKADAPGFARIMKKCMEIRKKYPSKQILGWMHSHPGMSTSPSPQDLETNLIWEKYMKKDGIQPIMMIVNDKEFWIGTTVDGKETPLYCVIMPDASRKIDLNLEAFNVNLSKDVAVDSMAYPIVGPDGEVIYMDIWGAQAMKEIGMGILNFISFGLYYKIRARKKNGGFQQTGKGGLESEKDKD